MYINIGKIVNTHGIKGEVRLLSDFKYKDRVFKKDFILYLGDNKKPYKIISYRFHKIFDMICFENINSINGAESLKFLNVYAKREDIMLFDDEILDSDLIGMSVYIDDKSIGKIKKIINTGSSNCVFEIIGEKRFLIPYNNNFINSIDLEKNVIVLKNVGGMI